MNTFTLRLQDAKGSETIDGVQSFVGEDDSGSFGLLSGHERMMTVLSFGLARFRRAAGKWEFLAMPGGVLYFHDDVLWIACRHYLRDDDFERIIQRIETQLYREEQSLTATRKSLHNMEQSLLRELYRMGHDAELAP